MLREDADSVKIRSIVENGMIQNVGSGHSILFWHDRWCEEGPLKVIFPRLFALSSQRNFFVAQMGSWHEDSRLWNLQWRRVLFDWESEDAVRLETLPLTMTLKQDASDGVSWYDSGPCSFPVKNIVAKVYDGFRPILPKQATSSISFLVVLFGQICSKGTR